MKIFLKIPTLLLIGALLNGCTSPMAIYSPLNNPSIESFYEPKNANDIIIYLDKKPTQAYDEMGVISYTTRSSVLDQNELFKMFREKAAEIGADAILMLPTKEGSISSSTTAYDYYGMPYFIDRDSKIYSLQCVAIKFKK